MQPQSYDVVLLLSVLGKADGPVRVGMDTLARMLTAARRQVYIRFGANYRSERVGITLADIMATCDEAGFTSVCFARNAPDGHIVLASRIGTDAKLGTVPPLVLVPTERLALPCTNVGMYIQFEL